MGSDTHRKPGRPKSVAGRFDPRLGAVVGVVLLLLLLATIGFIRGVRPRQDTLTEARRTGVIRIGYAVEAPYAFLTPEGKVTGESPELARVIAARLGIPRVEWHLVEFGDLLEGLEDQRFDVIAAGMFITPERERHVTFSRPSFQVGPGLLVRKGNPLALHSYADLLARTNARVAVLAASVEESELLRLGCAGGRLLRVPDATSGRAAVSSGQADALALSAPTIRWMVANPIAGETEMAEPFEAVVGTTTPSAPRARGGFAFRKDDRALTRAWNGELAAFIGSDDHRRLVTSFGFTRTEVPAPGDPPRNALPR